jgi:CIC family chloride channel protein
VIVPSSRKGLDAAAEERQGEPVCAAARDDRGGGFTALADRLRRGWPGVLLRFAPSEAQRVFALTVVLGGLCGLAAVAFHLFIDVVTNLAIDRAMAVPGRAWIGWTLAVPALGGLASGAALYYLVPAARGSGIPQVKAAYAGRSPSPRLRDAFGKFLLSGIQIGTGSSLGREGPTVHICAGIASRVGRFAGISPKNQNRLLPVGAAAGIAAAFNAPIAAVTFTIEEVVGKLDQTVLSGVIVAAAIAAIVERSVLGTSPIFSIPREYGLEHVSSLLLYAVLGLVSAGLSLLFTEGLLGLRMRFATSGGRLRWAQPAVGALVTGGLAALALGGLGVHGVTGGGYATLGDALAGKLPAAVLVALCLLKLAATVFSYSSGGAGGIFAPALFIGGMAGGAVGVLDVGLLHHSPASLGAFALVGMGAVFAGIVRAPITSVLIIIEMTGGYSLILPLMIANMLAYGIARHYRPTPIYEALLEQDGISLQRRELGDALEGVPLSDVPMDTSPHASFGPSATHADLVRALASNGRQEIFPVLDGPRLLGIITLADLISIASLQHLEGIANAADVMRPPVAVRQDDDLRTAFEAMLAEGVRELPAIDAEGHIVGFVDETSIAHAYAAARGRARPG